MGRVKWRPPPPTSVMGEIAAAGRGAEDTQPSEDKADKGKGTQTAAAGTCLGEERAGGGGGMHTAASLIGLDKERAGGVGYQGEERPGDTNGGGNVLGAQTAAVAATNLDKETGGGGEHNDSGDVRAAQEVAHCGAWPTTKSRVSTRGLAMDEVAKTTAGTPMVVTVEPAEQTAAVIDEPVSEPVVAADESVAAANEPMEGTVAADEPTVREGIVAPTRLISPEKGDGPEREGGPPERGGMGRGPRIEASRRSASSNMGSMQYFNSRENPFSFFFFFFLSFSSFFFEWAAGPFPPSSPPPCWAGRRPRPSQAAPPPPLSGSPTGGSHLSGPSPTSRRSRSRRRARNRRRALVSASSGPRRPRPRVRRVSRAHSSPSPARARARDGRDSIFESRLSLLPHSPRRPAIPASPGHVRFPLPLFKHRRRPLSLFPHFAALSRASHRSRAVQPLAAAFSATPAAASRR
ncbi:hypothetical protein DAI22_01g236250 [Oryza sativa Japonica Group]|nr:hypothetical protein DAI22_01g236250 [Oryza sativa Japonica Group]